MRAVPEGFQDCGTNVLTSGWPTTTAGFPGVTDCIVDAADRGVLAQYSYSGRDFANGMEGHLYRSDGGGAVRIIYQVDVNGAVTEQRTVCDRLAAGVAFHELRCL